MARQFSAHVGCVQTAGSIKIPLDIEVGLCPGNIVLAGWTKMPLGTEVGLVPRLHCVRWGSSSHSPPQKKNGAGSPTFSAHVCCDQTGWIKDATWYGGKPGPCPYCVRWGPTDPKGAQPPIFGPCMCCGQTARSIKMPLGRKVYLGPGKIVLDGISPPPCLLWPNGWMDQDATSLGR